MPTLGICLGHQVVAVALGGRAARNPRGQQVGLLEQGWLPDAGDDPLLAGSALPRRGVQWNDDIVTELPDGARLLAATPDGEPQVVRFAPTVWGVQCHPEVDVTVLASWADGDRDDHLEKGIDQAAVLAEIEAAADELEASLAPRADALRRAHRPMTPELPTQGQLVRAGFQRGEHALAQLTGARRARAGAAADPRPGRRPRPRARRAGDAGRAGRRRPRACSPSSPTTRAPRCG